METTRRILIYITLIACLTPTIDARRGGGGRGGRGGGGMRRSGGMRRAGGGMRRGARRAGGMRRAGRMRGGGGMRRGARRAGGMQRAGGMRRGARRGAGRIGRAAGPVGTGRIGRAAGPGRDRRGTAWRSGRSGGRAGGGARWRRGDRGGRRWRDGRRDGRGRRWRRRGWGWGPYINLGWPWYWGDYDGYYDNYYPATPYVPQSTEQAQQYLDNQQSTYWAVSNNTDNALILTNAAGETTTLNPSQQTQISHAQGFDLKVASPDGQNQTTITTTNHSINFSLSRDGYLNW